MQTVKMEMTRKVVFVTEDDKLSEAFDSMRVLQIQHIPVVRDGRLVGILSDRDILLHASKNHGRIQVGAGTVADAMIRDCTETPKMA